MKNLMLNCPSILTHEQAMAILRPHLINIAESIKDGCKMWKRLEVCEPEISKPLNSTLRAMFVHLHTVDAAKRRFSDVKGVFVADNGKYLKLVFEERIVLRFKKLDDGLYPRSIQTQHFLEYLGQQCFPGFERTSLIVGYRLDESQSRIADIHVVCPTGFRENKWFFEIETNVSTSLNIDQPVSEVEQSARVRPVSIEERKLHSE